MSPIWKVSGIIGALGTVGGGLAVTHYLTKGYANISERLAGVGYQVLNVDGDSGEWDKILLAYNKINKSDEIFEGSTATQETKEKLINKCRSTLTLEPSKESDYQLAKRWCVKEQTMKEMLESNGYTKLEASGTGNNKEKWLEKVNRLRRETKGKNTIVVTLNNNNEQDVTALKIDTAKTHESKDFETHFIQAKEWCSLKNKK